MRKCMGDDDDADADDDNAIVGARTTTEYTKKQQQKDQHIRIAFHILRKINNMLRDAKANAGIGWNKTTASKAGTTPNLEWDWIC